MRNMSFFLTAPQIRAHTKAVTRRLGWGDLKKGDRVNACVKCRGLKKGERVEKICVIEIVSNRPQVLGALLFSPRYGAMECVLEGFPEMTPEEFFQFFCRTHRGCDSETKVNRIEFRYV